MITENYLQIMIDSLLKKIEILKKVSELNEQQSALLDDKEFDGDKLQSNMESKAAYIDELNSLDEGFQAVFDRVKEDVEEYKADYKEITGAYKRSYILKCDYTGTGIKKQSQS